MTRSPVFFITGKHPTREVGGFGHSVYVRAHARAATAAGRAPQMFCIAEDDLEETEPFGTVYGLRSRLAARQVYLPVFGPRLASAVVERALRLPSEEPILIHAFGAWSYAGALALARLRRAGRRAAMVVSSYTTHLDENREMYAGWSARDGARRRASLAIQVGWSRCVVDPLEGRGYRAASIVAANYRNVARMIAARHGIDDVRIVRYTSDEAFARATPAREPRSAPAVPRVVSVSGHFERKGLDVLMRAYVLLRERGVAFRADMVGGGALLASHRALARDLGLDDVLAIPGVVPDVEPYLAEADVYVLPSRSEQSGALSLIEALERGLPAVASDCDGIPEDLEGSQAGILVAPGDERALADALERLIASPEERTRRGRAARELFDRRFSPEAFVADLDRIYADLARA